jgi:hypothetical protein
MTTVTRASAATTATNTAIVFTLLGLMTSVVFLIVNAALVFTTMTNIKPPDIKRVVVKGLENGPVRLYLDLEFPGTARGNLISAQTEGPLKVSAFITERGKKPSENPSLLVKIPSGINLNLASNKPTRLIIDDLEIKLDESFDSRIIANIIAAKMNNNFKPELLPNITVRIDTRVVFKSLWIPLGASVNMPIEIDLADMMNKSIEKEKNEGEQKKEKVLSAREIEKEKVIKAFDFKPRLVKVAASNSDKLEIHAVAAIPAAYVPDFLTVEIPNLKFQANFYELAAEMENSPIRVVQLEIEEFLLEPAPMNNLNAEINFKASLEIGKSDVDGVKKILELVREDKKYKVGIQIKPSEEYIATKVAGGLLYWLRDFVLNIPVGEMLMKMDDANKLNDDKVVSSDANRTETSKEISKEESKEVEETKAIINETVKDNKQKTVFSAKFLRTEKTLHGGKFIFQIKILHSAVDFLVGSLPEINFQTVLDDETKLLGIKIYSNVISKESPTIEINIAIEINNLKQAVFTGLLLSKMGTEEMHKKLPEVRAIKGLKVEFTSDNIISKIASSLNLNVLFGENGIESVKFQNSDYIIFPKPEITKIAEDVKDGKTKVEESNNNTVEKVEKPQKIKISENLKNLELFAKFAIENNGKKEDENKDVHIGASVDLEEVPYSGDVAYVSWKHFDLTVNYKMESLLVFKIYRGAAKVGINGGIKPLFASFATGILIPSNDKNLVNMKNFLKSVMYANDEIIHLNFDIKYGKSKTNIKVENEPILLNASIPCKNLLFAKPNKDEVLEKDKKDKETKPETIDSSKDSTKSKEDENKTDSNAETKAKEDNNETDKDDERTDFIGKVKNSIISFVSFHATTLFFHVTYPNGEYCKPELLSNYDLKINFDVILPMIEANVCSKDDINAELNCFASAGVSRPMKLSAKIIDGQVCRVESLILTQEAALYDDPTFKALNSYKYEYNEIPVHVSVKSLKSLVRFVDMIGDKRKQFLTVGPVETATNVNKFIGVVISSVFELEFKSSANKEKILKPLTIFYNQESTALIDIRAASATPNELEFLVNFKLPETALLGIPMVTANENRFQWPAIRWGNFEYSFGVEKLFKLSFAVNRGQVDIHEDGIVLSALNDLSLRLKFITDESVHLGSTNFRIIIGAIKDYLDPKKDENNFLNSNFINDINDHTFSYKFIMENPRELNEGISFSSEGSVRVKQILDVINTIINRDNLSDKSEGANTIQKIVIADSSDNNPFKDLRITVKTVDQERKSILELPCLIPALCKKDSLNQDDSSDVRNDGEPMSLVFEIENLLVPATELIGSKIGPVLRNFKMADYPSNLKFSAALLSDVWVTMVLDGAGLASVGLSKKTTMFTRSVNIDYGSEVTNLIQNERVKLVDKLELPLQFRFPKTVVGLRKTLAIFRRESLLIPPVAPLYYEFANSGSMERVTLTNAPLMISFSSDDRHLPGAHQKNLLSAIIAAGIPERNVGSINADFMLDMVRGKYVKPGEPKAGSTTATNLKGKNGKKSDEVNAEGPSKNSAAQKEEDTITEMGPFGTHEYATLGSCILTGISCSQIDLNFNMKLKFAVQVLKMILPNTSIFRLSVDRSTFFQFVADSRKQRSFEVSIENGLDIMGTASIHLQGLPPFSHVASTTAADLIRSKTGEHEINLNVIVGHDIDFKAKLYFPLDLVKTHIMSKMREYTNFLNVFENDHTEELKKLLIKPETGVMTLSIAILEEFRPENRECIDNKVGVKDRFHRLQGLDYSKSAIYFKKDNEVLIANKESKIFLQLRSSNEQVVCGLPEAAKDLEIEFIRNEQEQGFINIVDFLSFKAPPARIVEKGKVTFNHAFNLFVVELKLPYPGRYIIKVKNVKAYNSKSKLYEDGTTELQSAFLYVKNNY